MNWITVFVLVVTAGAISGRRIRRGNENRENVNGKIDHERGEPDTSGSGETIGECGGGLDRNGYEAGPEVAYNRDGRPPVEEHRGTAGHTFSKASASASASSSSYNMNHKTNVIPV